MAALTLDQAHAGLLRNEALQFGIKVPERAASPSPWLPDWDGLTIVWVLAVLVVLAIVVLAARTLRQRRAPAVAMPQAGPADDGALPLAGAQLALGDADALAQGGRFLDAARVLLACGLDEIARLFPSSLRPATTSRDIAGLASLPPPLRTAFGRIAGIVEIGLFGGRTLGPEQYADCRAVFVASALADRR